MLPELHESHQEDTQPRDRISTLAEHSQRHRANYQSKHIMSRERTSQNIEKNLPSLTMCHPHHGRNARYAINQRS